MYLITMSVRSYVSTEEDAQCRLMLASIPWFVKTLVRQLLGLRTCSAAPDQIRELDGSHNYRSRTCNGSI